MSTQSRAIQLTIEEIFFLVNPTIMTGIKNGFAVKKLTGEQLLISRSFSREPFDVLLEAYNEQEQKSSDEHAARLISDVKR